MPPESKAPDPRKDTKGTPAFLAWNYMEDNQADMSFHVLHDPQAVSFSSPKNPTSNTTAKFTFRLRV